MIKAGIIGGAGYTAGELLRILIHHPSVEVMGVMSESQAGKSISEVHTDLIGDTNLKFINEIPGNIDVLFLCTGHGTSKKFMEQNALPKDLKIIDLSQDFRDETEGFVYGLPEYQRDRIIKASKIANPGCFATAIQLALLPLAANQEIKDEVHIHAITGSTGAGVHPTESTHFSWRSNNISAYKVFEHQHLLEIKKTVYSLNKNDLRTLNFIPLRGDFTRGIYATTYTRYYGTEEEAKEMYQAYYKNHPFTIISESNPDLKQVVNTNKAILNIKVYDDKIFIISMIDNLVKGASGQAVQNMNLMFGKDEKEGLNLKPSGF